MKVLNKIRMWLSRVGGKCNYCRGVLSAWFLGKKQALAQQWENLITQIRLYLFVIGPRFAFFKKVPWILLLCISLAILIIGIPSYKYHQQFSKYGLSSATDAWGQLGDFLNVWVSMASLTVLSGLTFYLHSLDRNRERENSLTEDARSRPYLVIQKKSMGVITVKNIGNGPALNISHGIIRNERWGVIKKMKSLGSGDIDDFTADTTTNDSIIGLQYNDVHRKFYATLHRMDGVEILSQRHLFSSNAELFIEDLKINKIVDQATNELNREKIRERIKNFNVTS